VERLRRRLTPALDASEEIMSTDTLNLLLGVAGLVLGFVSAYSQLKAMTLRAMRVGGAAAGKLWANREARARFFIANSSALIAHVARCFIWFIAMVFLLSFFRPASLIATFGFPQWLAGAVAFAAPVVPGVILGSLVSMCALILELSQREAAGSERKGERKGVRDNF